jgi:hypothetical protein
MHSVPPDNSYLNGDFHIMLEQYCVILTLSAYVPIILWIRFYLKFQAYVLRRSSNKIICETCAMKAIITIVLCKSKVNEYRGKAAEARG